jgi:hypothetical protein
VELWPYWTTAPWHIRKSSSFLALHLATVGLIFALLLIYTVVAMYPLISTWGTDKYQQTVRITNSNLSDSVPHKCDKTFNVGNAWLKTAVGSFCTMGNYSSAYDCAKTCDLVRPRDANIDPSTLDQGENLNCTSILLKSPRKCSAPRWVSGT